MPLRRVGGSVRVQEAGDGPPVVFVHGASNTGVSWAQLVALLDGHRCLVMDRPGCGLSEPLASSFADVAALRAFADHFVVDVIDGLDLDEAHVISTSYGGYLTMCAALAHPDRIGRVVEMGFLPGARIDRLPFVMRASSVPGLGRIAGAIPANERMVRSMFKQIGLRQALAGGKVTQELIDCFVSILRDTDTMRNELRAGPRLIRPIRGFDEAIMFSPEALAAMRVPYLFIWGEEDPMGGAAEARRFAASVAGAELELVPGAGHAVWIDEPDLVATATRRFLER